MLENETTRRDFLRKSAVIGGVAWATPAIATLTASPAGAQTLYGCPECQGCQASAAGLLALGQSAGVANGTGCQCTTQADLNAGTVGGAAGNVVCGKADSTTCTASALVTGARIRVAANAVLEASLLSSCASCGTGASRALDLQLVTTTAGVDTRADVLVSGECNQQITLLDGTVVIVVNEQVCNDGVLTVNALRVTVAGQTVIAAQSRAGNQGCPCTPCSQTPRCTPPTTQLC